MTDMKSLRIEYKEVAINSLNKVNIHTQLGILDVPFCWRNKSEYDLYVKDMGLINLAPLVNFDMKKFEELNAREDERHQIDMSTLTLLEVHISEGVTPVIRLRYIFKQGQNFWRYCQGETSDLRRETEGMRGYSKYEPTWLACPIYSKGAFVPW